MRLGFLWKSSLLPDVNNRPWSQAYWYLPGGRDPAKGLFSLRLASTKTTTNDGRKASSSLDLRLTSVTFVRCSIVVVFIIEHKTSHRTLENTFLLYTISKTSRCSPPRSATSAKTSFILVTRRSANPSLLSSPLDKIVTPLNTFVTLVGYFPNIATLELDSLIVEPDEGSILSLSWPLRGKKFDVHEVRINRLGFLNRFAWLDLGYEGLVIDLPPPT